MTAFLPANGVSSFPRPFYPLHEKSFVPCPKLPKSCFVISKMTANKYAKAVHVKEHFKSLASFFTQDIDLFSHSACYHWWICLFVWLLSSFFYYFLIFLIFSFYFNNFILFLLFLPFLLSHVADRVLVIQPGVRPEHLRWESRVQDIGPPETSQAQIISIGESSPRDLCLKAKNQHHPMASKFQCWMPHANQLARKEYNHTH